jgi:hypothetical protein
MIEFFGPKAYSAHELPNFQEFDFDGVAGRLRSSSFIPTSESPNFQPMMAELKRIFDSNNQDGQVRLEYTTHIYLGRLGGIKDPA